MKTIIRLLLACQLVVVAMVTCAVAYDVTYTIAQPSPELVSGFKIKASPTKGGPYTEVGNCKKPAPNPDGSYDCPATGVTFNPIYGVVTSYDGSGADMASSAEYMAQIQAPPPAIKKIAITIRTVSSLTRYGNTIAKTTVTRAELPEGREVKEGTTGYRNANGEYITTTVLVM